MDIRQYSLWDTLGESARIRDVWSSTPDGVRMRRMVNRTRLFDAFGGSIDQTGALSDADRARLVRAYRQRARTWHIHLDAPATVGRDISPSGEWLDDLFLAGWDEGFILVLAALIVFGVAFGLLFVPAFVLPWYFIKVRKLHRCRMAVEKKICPDCEYDLTGCPEAIEPGWVEGVSIGPRRCPECSAPWPLLPPPSRSGLE